MKTTRTEHTSGQRLFALLLAALMVFGMVPVTGAAATTGGITTDGVRTDVNNITTVADPETLTRPETIYGNNTLNAGKVTVGKSVSTTNVTVSGQTVTLDDPDNFLVTISQSAQVMGLSTETSVPVDVVFVLDTSGSMSNSSRETTMVTAVNNAIKTLMAANSNNRVGVVAFSDIDDSGSSTEPAAEVLSNLASYTGDAATNHLTWSGSNIVGRGNGSGSRDGSNGGTNIQAGVVLGAKMLASATNLTVDGVTRMPFLIILSDGAPTYNFSSTTWYDPSMTGSQYGPGNDNGTLYTGNGFLPALVAAYYKGVITEHYYGTNASEDNRCNIYTLGVSIDNSDLAKLTMDPKTNFNANATGNGHSGRFATYWRNYQAGSTFSISCDNNQNLSISNTTIAATKNYVNGISSAGKTMYSGSIQYNDGYYSATDTSEIAGIFDKVLTEISKKAISSPTHVGSYGEDFSGYVSFYDPIGEYMEVKDMKGIVANGKFYQGISAAKYLSGYATSTEFNEMIRKVLTTRMSMTGSSSNLVESLLTGAKNSNNQAYYVDDNNYDNSIVWWGKSYDTNDEDPGVQVVGFADNDTVKYIEDAKAAGNVIPAGADYVCRSYFFYGTAGDTSVGAQNAEYLYFVVRVQRSLTAPYQQTVVISAPASLLSMDKVLITESKDDDGNTVYTASVEKADPARVVYEVGLRSDITAENVSTIVSSDYKNEAVNGEGSLNYDAATDTYTFFTNDWNRGESLDSHHRAMAHATFDAAADNAFYTYQEDTLLVQADGTTPVTSVSAGQTVYYVREYYEWGTTANADGTFAAVKKTKLIEVSIPSGTNLPTDGNGQYYIPKGTYTAATLVVNGDDAIKGDDPNTTAVEYDNKTGTSSIVAHPHRTGDASNSHYTVYLGNNGKLTLKANTPEPEKTVDILNADGTIKIEDADGNPVMVGEVLTYTVKAINTTAETGTVTITDNVPVGTELVSGTITNGGQYDAATGVITWTFANVAPGGEVTASFNVKVTEAALETAVGYIQNQATATIGGNSYQTNIVTNPPEGKKVTTSNPDGTVKVGDRLTYSIEFHNDAKVDGVYVTADVIITDVLPTGTTFISADHDGEYDSTTNTITWTLDDVLPNMGGVVTFTVEVNASAQTSITNGATIQVGGRNPSTNTTSTDLAKGNLSISKVLAPGDVANTSFELTLTDATGKLGGTTGTAYTVTGSSVVSSITFTNGVGRIRVKADEPITIVGLPAGVDLTVVETPAAGWTPTYSSGTVTVPAGGTAPVTVTNDYYAEPVHFQLKGVKTFLGTNFPNGTFAFRAQECTYDAATGTATVVSNGIAVDAVATYEADGSAEIVFSERTFASAFERYYLITELASDTPNVTSSQVQYLLYLKASDNGAGKMVLDTKLWTRANENSAWTEVPGGTNTSASGTVTVGGANFTNTYVAPVTVTVSGMKALLGRAQIAGEFDFLLIDSVSKQAIATATNAADGSFTFAPALRFTKEDAGKTFTYYIREDQGTATYVTYDDTYYQVDVKVAMNSDGTALVTSYDVYKWEKNAEGNYANAGKVGSGTGSSIVLDKDGDGQGVASFENTFAVQDTSFQLTGTKNLFGAAADGLTAGEFDFDIYKAKLDASTNEYVIDGEQPVSSGRNADSETNTAAISFSRVYITAEEVKAANGGSLPTDSATEVYLYYIVKEHIPGSDSATFDENMGYDDSEYVVKVTVTYDPVSGTLSATGHSIVSGPESAIIFNNYQNPSSISVTPVGTKIINGSNLPAGLSFSFKVVPVSGGADAATGTSTPVTGSYTAGSAIDVQFTSLVYDSDDLGDKDMVSFKYWIMESNTGSAGNGITYSQARYLYVVDLYRNDETNALQVNEYYYKLNDGATVGSDKVEDYTTLIVTISSAANATSYAGVQNTVKNAVTFTNTYAAEASINLTATKDMDGMALNGREFDFLLQRLDGNGVIVSGSEVSGSNAATVNGIAPISFATLNYTSSGTDENPSILSQYTPSTDAETNETYWLISYLMSEVKPEGVAIPGVTYDSTKYIVTIKVTQSTGESAQTGSLTAELYSVYEAVENNGSYTAKTDAEDKKAVTAENPGNTGVTFENSYKVSTGDSVNLLVTKNLTGRFLRENEFEFSLHRYSGTDWTFVTTESNNTTGSNTGVASFIRHFNANTLDHMADEFTNIDEDEHLEYVVYYKITEDDDGLGGVDYSDAVYYVKVVIEHNEDTASYDVESVGYYTGFAAGTTTGEPVENVVFNNTYTTGDAVLQLVGTKEMVGPIVQDYTFRFEVVELNDDYTPITFVSGKNEDGTDKVSNKVVATGSAAVTTENKTSDITFGSIIYNETVCHGHSGIHFHYYEIWENAGSAQGVSYDPTHYYLKVEIDHGSGTVAVKSASYHKGTTAAEAFASSAVYTETVNADGTTTVTGEKSAVKFTNHYGPGYIDLELDIDKAFRVKISEGVYESYIYKLNGSEFDFQVFNNAGCSGDPVTVGTNGPSDDNGIADIIFGSIVIEKEQLVDGNNQRVNEKTFTYYIKEVKRSGAAHIGIDESVIKVDVTVTDDGWGNLTAAYVYTNATTGNNQTFINTYEPADVSVTLEVDKNLSGKKLTDETFTFVLTDKNGVEVGTWTQDPAGKYSVKLTYKPQDLAGVGMANGVYTKTFTYTLKEAQTVVNGSSYGTYDYDDTVYTVTVTLTDNGSGNLVAVTEVKKGSDVVNAIVFNNTYTPNPINMDLDIGIDASKVVEDPNGNTVSYLLAGHQFKVYDLSGNPVIGADGAEIVGVSGADGKINFSKFKFSAAGESRYLIKEVIPEGAVQNADGTYTYQGMTYDNSVWCTHILVRYDAQTGELYINDGSEEGKPDDVYTHLFSGESSHGDGVQAQAETTPVFRNVYDPTDVSVTITAKKLLDGRDLKDNEFTFRLLNADGTIAAEAHNKADGTITFHLNYDLDDLTGQVAKSFAYSMVEVIPDEKLGGVEYAGEKFYLSVTVTDNEDGTLTANVSPAGAAFTFTNTYTAQEAEVQIQALKRMEGTKPLGEGDYTFRLVDNNDTTKVYIAKNDADGNIVFDLPAYTKADVYTYTLTEVTPTIIGGSNGGMTYDETEYTVTVTVTDDLVGQLHADVVYTDKDSNVYAIPVFTNSYLANGAQATIEADKVLTGKTLTAGEFTFKLFDAEGNELDAVTNDASGNVVFTPIAFGGTGVYTFTISEVKGDNAGMTYDETVFDVTVTVTDENFDGQLDVEVAYSKNGTAVTGVPKFQNTYKPASVDVQISAEKDLNGKDLEAEEFSFNLVGNGENLTAKNDADGKITFPKITIDAADMVDENGNPVANKSFQYTITEVKGNNPGMAYDVSKYVATVIVTDDGKGHLSAVVEYTKDQVTISTDVPVFNNSYVPGSVNVTIEAEKVLNGKTLVAGQFSFVLKAEDGTVLETVTNDANGKITIKPITYTDAKVYTYTLSEVKGNAQGMTYDGTVYTITVTVTDDGNGQLVAATEYEANGKVVEEITFTNTYKGLATTVDVTAKKALEGKTLTAGAYTFKLVNKDNAEEFYTADNAADGTITFQDLRFTEPGVYTYLMSEVKGSDSKTAYDDTVYTVTITVTDDLQGSLKAVVDFGGKTAVFTNVYTPDPISVPLKGTKELTGRDQVAGEFTFEVRDADGKLITTGTNAADGTIIFEDIKVYGAGEAVLYVSEVAGDAERMTYDNYTYRVKLVVTNDNGVLVASVTYLDGDIVFYNEYQPDAPLTGDDTPVGLYAGLLGTSLMALAAVLVLYRKKETV